MKYQIPPLIKSCVIGAPVDWASEKQEQSPSFNQLAVCKENVEDENAFKDFIQLYGLKIIQEEDFYYILDGDPEDLADFSKDWKYNL